MCSHVGSAPPPRSRLYQDGATSIREGTTTFFSERCTVVSVQDGAAAIYETAGRRLHQRGILPNCQSEPNRLFFFGIEIANSAAV
jgi:hypothetical protein